jgi:hypothetical protein
VDQAHQGSLPLDQVGSPTNKKEYKLLWLDPDPAVFVIDLQDANKKLIFV